MTPHALLQRCRGCHGGAWDVVLEMERMPLAGQFCRSEAEAKAADLLPLTWVQCRRCALVQVLEDVADEHLFQQYNYASSTVPGLVRHFEAYAAFLARRYPAAGTRLLEIGCNDGVLLRHLPASWRLTGVDPSDVARAVWSPEGGYRLVAAPFGAATAAQLPEAGTYDVVTGSNCLAHIADLADVFSGVRRVLRDGGELWVEVHDLDATLAGSQWDTIYHEHKVEWSERSLDACLGEAGFERVHLERLPLHGGLLRAGYRKVAAAGRPPSPAAREDFRPLREAYAGRRATPVYRALSEAFGRGARAAAYGASGRANVWLNQLPELRFEYVVDDAPLRAHRWIPRVATPILPSPHFRESPPDACVITAWNYARDIRAKHAEYRGTWLQTFEG